jgi:hypothetical protein
MECRGEGVGPGSPDAPDLLPLAGIRPDEGSKAPEVRQQCLRAYPRNPGNACEGGLGGGEPRLPLGALSVRRHVAKPNPGEALEPERGIPCVRRADHTHAQVHERHANSTNCGSGERPIVEVATLDEHVREARNLADSPELGPERSLDHSCVQTAHRLPLDDGALPNLVVPGPQAPRLDGYSELAKKTWYPARSFLHIRNDPDVHRHTLAHRPLPIHRTGVPLQEQLGLSRSESP